MISTEDLSAKILEEAADLIETVGHAKGTSWALGSGPSGERIIVGYCMTGAMHTVIVKESSDIKANANTVWDTIGKALNDLLPEWAKADGFQPYTMMTTKGEKVTLEVFDIKSPQYIAAAQDWNDFETTTREQVVDIMKHAAKDIRNKGEAA